MSQSSCRVVITGLGVISPLGNSVEELWDGLAHRKSGIDFLTRIPGDHLPSKVGGEASSFTGHIDDFGELEKKLKRTIKKGLKLMCREIEMGVASAQLAIADAALSHEHFEPERIGTLFGSDYIITEPGEFASGIKNCIDDNQFDFGRWGENGLNQVEPLWLLKYLPNMPASHVAIYNDFRGPSNSLTVREASSNMAIAEATTILKRGIAEAMVVGATGSRIHPLRSVHVALQEKLAHCDDEGSLSSPGAVSRPFDHLRRGMVMGEGAGTVILENYDSAVKRGAKIYGEVIGYGSSTVADRKYVADYKAALTNVLKSGIESANIDPAEVGHVHAHGLSTLRCDREEAEAISAVLGPDVPVVAAKGNIGNLGAGGGIVELAASVKAFDAGNLFPAINFERSDDEVQINLVKDDSTSPGGVFVNLNVTPQGQASSVVIRCPD
ncbi:MAG: beta-ketoacyl-[acyl-carrier-protein] synthase family protein [Planctomycetota bacterium]